ncbi:MAG TPA: ABC transporter permease [Trebonia sp.]|nr:ABC transporter permease [Trebonia sp.]
MTAEIPAIDGPLLVQVGQHARGGEAGRLRIPAVPRAVRRYYGPVLLLVAWQVASSAGWLHPNIFPAPASVLSAGRQLIADGQLQSNLWSSLRRVLLGLGFGIAAGTALAVLAGLTRRGEDLIDSTVQVIKSIPVYAVIPLLITWLGIGEEPKIVVIAIGVGVTIYVNTYGAIRNVDAQLVEAARTLGVSRLSLIANVIIPGSLPGFLVGLRLALVTSWLSLIFAETINTQSGIGFLMTEAEDQFQLNVMVLLIVVYAVLGLLGYAVVRFLERTLLAWRQGFEGA